MRRLNLSTWTWWRIDAAGVAVVLAMAGLFYFLGIGPIFSRHAGIAAAQDRLDAQRRTASGLSASVASLKTRLAHVSAALEKTPLKLEKAARINQRLSRLADLAAACYLKLDGIEPGETSREERYETVPIRLSGTGSYKACAAFLHRLHQDFPDTGVSSFQISGVPAQPTLPAQHRFELIWYAAPTLTPPGG